MAQVREQTAQRTGRAAIRESLQNDTVISDLDIKQERQATEVKQGKQRVTHGSQKLADAHEKGAAMEQELRALCSDVIQRIEAIGLQIARSGEFRGVKEKTLAFLGQFSDKAMNKAQALRVSRLDTASVEEACREVETFVQETIEKLGTVEAEYVSNVESYGKSIDTVLSKLKEATPRQLQAEQRRAELEGRYNALDLELKSGTIEQKDRPAKEAEFEALKRDLEKVRLDVMEFITIVTEAQRAIPTLQKSKDAAALSIESVHGMRRNLLEKWQNLAVVLENSMTAVRARAQLERYQAVDPALNRSVEVITDHNVAVAGAALEIAAQRLKHAAISPERSRELLQQLTGHVNDFLKEFADVEREAHEGVRHE